MPRLTRHTVKFKVDDVDYIATFGHQHATRKLIAKLVLETPGKPVRGNGFNPVDRRLVEQVYEEIPIGSTGKDQHGREVVQRLRHITRCHLRVNGVTVAEGTAKCSFKDEYNWKKGIREAFIGALAMLDVTPEKERERFGKFIQNFYIEMHRANVEAEVTE